MSNPAGDKEVDRRLAEVEFVTSAYSPEEAWCDNADENYSRKAIQICRRLDLRDPTCATNTEIQICLTLVLPSSYPTESALQVEGVVMPNGRKISGKSVGSNSATATTGEEYLRMQKVVYNLLPSLISSCRKISNEYAGEEAVFIVLNHAEEWIQEEWPVLYKSQRDKSNGHGNSPWIAPAAQRSLHDGSIVVVLGRRLIYSHHIISKIKRRDIRDLAKQYNLTGYVKIGWPGIIIVEGLENDCIAFYDVIRRWAWQYLVVRGEQQEQLTPSIASGNTSTNDDVALLESHRKFRTFEEVDDMSIVAQHCREVGLEALFQTSMKVYSQGDGESITEVSNLGAEEVSPWYGALVHVDHMNNGRAYRKWLRKASRETCCYLLIRQYDAHNSDCNGTQITKNSTIITVGIVAEERTNVAHFLKRWRTSKVDVDSSGKPCLERKLSILVEGAITSRTSITAFGIYNNDYTETFNKEESNIFLQMAMESDVSVTAVEELLLSVSSFGGEPWKIVLERLLLRKE